MRGVLLLGGNGTRLLPTTMSISKHLLPVYNKPLVYYSLSTIMLAGLTDVMLVTRPEDQRLFFNLLGDGSDYGISIHYATQRNPSGVPDAIALSRSFIGQEQAFVVLGDNILYGTGLTDTFKKAQSDLTGATIFSYAVTDPHRYGVIEVDKNHCISDILEKPRRPKSNLAITGHYMLANNAIDMINELRTSSRGETEIVDLIKAYWCNGSLQHSRLSRGFVWFDAGVHDSLLEASTFVEKIEKRQGYMVGCLEEIALNNGWIDRTHVESTSLRRYSGTQYGNYLKKILQTYE